MKVRIHRWPFLAREGGKTDGRPIRTRQPTETIVCDAEAVGPTRINVKFPLSGYRLFYLRSRRCHEHGMSDYVLNREDALAVAKISKKA